MASEGKGFVYGLHAFIAENEDEISFGPGERVLVLEKDDQYGDGWWQGRNAEGIEGLFPVSYTSPNPVLVDSAGAVAPSTNGPEASGESEQTSRPTSPRPSSLRPSSPSRQNGPAAAEPSGKQTDALVGGGAVAAGAAAAGASAAVVSSSNRGPGGESSHMSETMTDLDRAIKQLGTSTSPRSTTYGGSHYEGDSFVDELGSLGGGGAHTTTADEDDAGWSVNTRKRLAEQALNENLRREAREKELREQEERGWTGGLPADAEFSDESEEEDDGGLSLPGGDAQGGAATSAVGRNGSLSRQEEEEEEEEKEEKETSTSTAPIVPLAAPIPVAPISDDKALDESDIPVAPTPPTSKVSSTAASVAATEQRPELETAASAQSTFSSLASDSTIPATTIPAASPSSTTTDATATAPQPLSVSERSTRALEAAATEPSAVAKEPSPFRAIVPDQVGPHEKLSSVEPSSVAAAVAAGAGAVAAGTGAAVVASSQHATPADHETPGASISSTPAVGTPTSPRGDVNPFDGLPPLAGSSASDAGGIDGVSTPGGSSDSRSRRPSVYGTGLGAAGVEGDPMEWSPEDVAEWARRRGFNESICSKFLEHEITGDVLLELDIGLLKEIDIHALGKRMKLAGAIAELRSLNQPSGQQQQYPGVASSIRSGQTSLHAQSPTTFGSPTLGGSSGGVTGGHDSMPSPVFVFGSQQSLSQQQSRQGSTVPSEISGPIHESSEYDAPNGPLTGSTIASGASGPVVGGPAVVGLGFNGTDKLSSMHDSADLSHPSSPGAVPSPALPTSADRSISSHSRRQSDLVGTQIAEEPEPSSAALPTSASAPATVLLPSAGAVVIAGAGAAAVATSKLDSSKTAAASSPKEATAPPASLGSKPSSPNVGSSGVNSIGKRASVNHKKSKPSLDEGGSIKSSSFVGSLMGRGSRKPAPRLSSGTSGVISPQSSPKLGGTAEERSPSSPVNRSPKVSSPVMSSSAGQRRMSKDLSSPTSAGGASGNVLRKRMPVAKTEKAAGLGDEQGSATRALDRIPKPEFQGYLRKKGERYNSWKLRYCVLSGPHLYYLKSENDTKFKGYVNMQGYKVIADENAHPGYYGFRLVHDKEAPHFFSLQEQSVIREWMKALMKATITRNYSTAVVSSCNIPTITLKEAQAMSPAPRPPSPSQRAATQLAVRRDNPNQLTARDASILMGIQSGQGESATPAGDNIGERDSISGLPPMSLASAPRESIASQGVPESAPPRPSREMRRPSSVLQPSANVAWVNAHLPKGFPSVVNNPESFRSGLALVRLVENITGLPADEFPLESFNVKSKAEHEDLIYKAFDYFIDAGVDMDGIHADDVVLGRAEGIDKLIDAIRIRQRQL